MPVEYSATRICDKCKKEFEWVYFHQVRTKLSEIPYINDAPPANKKLAYLFQENADDSINVGVNCPYCDYDNQFTTTKKA